MAVKASIAFATTNPTNHLHERPHGGLFQGMLPLVRLDPSVSHHVVSRPRWMLRETKTMTATCELHEDQRQLVELVLQAQSGDREAFGQLVERYQRSIYATAVRRLRNPSEAQELVQEVFVQALRKIDQLRQPEAFGGWLRSITVRMAANRLTRRRIMLTAEPEVLSAACADEHTPLAAALANERRHQVRLGLRRLRTMDRETLVAFYIKGRSLAEMSCDFSSPVGTIKRRLHVARKRLAKELEGVCNV